MFLDYLRNGQGSTAIWPWLTRARAGGAVAVPVSCEELADLDCANAFDIFTAAKRAQGPDAWGWISRNGADADRAHPGGNQKALNRPAHS